jgi:hypothetical protein
MIRDIIQVVINLEHIDYLKISLFLNRIWIGEHITRETILTKFRISSHNVEIEKGRYISSAERNQTILLLLSKTWRLEKRD